MGIECDGVFKGFLDIGWRYHLLISTLRGCLGAFGVHGLLQSTLGILIVSFYPRSGTFPDGLVATAHARVEMMDFQEAHQTWMRMEARFEPPPHPSTNLAQAPSCRHIRGVRRASNQKCGEEACGACPSRVKGSKVLAEGSSWRAAGTKTLSDLRPSSAESMVKHDTSTSWRESCGVAGLDARG